MTFVKGQKPTKGFTGKTHSEQTKRLQSFGQKQAYLQGRKKAPGGKRVKKRVEESE